MNTSSADKRRLILALTVATLLAAFLWATKPLGNLDRSWSDQQLTGHALTTRLPLAIIEITAADLGRYGGPPIGRNVIADVLNRLERAGVARVLIDMLMVDTINEQDQTLIDALQRLGPQRVALASGIEDGFRPHPSLAEGLPTLDTRLTPDGDGWYRGSFTHGVGIGPNPSLWLASGRLEPLAIPLDLRLSAASIPVLNFQDILEGDGAGKLEGALVILSHATAIGAPRTYIPGHGEAGRAMVMALGAASFADGQIGRALLGKQLLAGLFLAALVCGTLLGLKARSRKALMIGAPLFFLTNLGVALVMTRFIGTSASPFTIFTIFTQTLTMALFHRLRISSLVSVFMRRDVSPEEAWAWRSLSDSPQAVVLFDALGGIKRVNTAGQSLKESHGEDLGRLSMPRMGERTERLELPSEGKVYHLEWPYPLLPIALFRDITMSVRTEANLRDRLVTDPMTGLMNRTGFDEALEEAGSQTDTGYALFYMDLNGFKQVNDTYGHDAGDEILRHAARMFRKALRAGDAIARLGGDEFAVLAKGELNDKIVLAIRDKLEASLTEPVTFEGGVAKVGVAVGTAMPTYLGEPISDVIKRADHAMYKRKAFLKGKPIPDMAA